MSSPAADGGVTTVVFVDVEGSTALVDRIGDHAGTAAVMQQLNRVRDRLEPYGGREVKSLGDGLMLTFSSPRQAVGFALATQRALIGTAPRVRIGINAGEVFDVHTDPVGGAVNAASRIAGRANGGEVLVSDVIRQLIGLAPAIRFADRGRVRLKGFTDRWHLWAAEDSTSTAATRGTVGRVHELTVVRDLIASTVTGEGQTLLVEGEAGIGKTHLVREAADSALDAGITVVEVIADEVMRRPGTLPHGLLEDRRVLGPPRIRLSELLDRTAASGDGEDRSFAVIDASVDVVESLTVDHPLLLVFEDVHWADDLSLAVMRALVRRASVSRFSLLASMRPSPRSALLDRLIELVIGGNGRHIHLDALDEVDIYALSAAITGAAPGQGLRERLGATAGNPLFATELLRTLDDEGHLRISSGIAEISASTMPTALSDTLVRRLSWLPGETREVLRTASLLGTSFTLTDLAVVTGRTVIEVAAWLREASAAGLIVGDGDRLTFRHDLIREAVYGHMLPAERRDLHRAAGRALSTARAPTQQVARQFARGALPGDVEAVEWLQRAALETTAISPSGAIALYDEALALAPDLWPERSALQARMIEPLAWCGRFERAEELATSVLASAPGHEVEFAALRGLSAVYGNRGDITAAIAKLQQAAAVPGAPSDETTRLTCMAAQLQVMTGALSTDAARTIGAETLAIGIATNDPTTQCLAHQVLGVIDTVTGCGADAGTHLREAIALYDSGRVHPASYLIPDMFYAIGLLDLDDVDGAFEAAAQARARSERRGALSQMPMAHMAVAGVHYYAGRYDEALTEIEVGMAVIDDTGNLNFVLYNYAVLAKIALRRGDPATAQAHLSAGTDRLAAGRSLFGVDWLFGAQAEYVAATGDPVGALTIAEITWTQTAFIRYFFGHRERAVFLTRLAIAGDRHDLALEVTSRLDEGSHRTPAATARASALQCRGLIEDEPTSLLEAVELFRSTPLRPALAICCEDAAISLARRARHDEAIGCFQEAATIYTDIGAHGDLARVDGALRVLGHRPRRRRPARPSFGWDALTPMETSVSELVAGGLTNPEIGVRLYVSRRTVETHLAHIFRKLDFVSRTQLAAEVTRRTTKA